MNMNNEEHHNILLVEDDTFLAVVEQELLEEKGYVVSHVHSGEEAIVAVCEEKNEIELILMDIDLGSGMDGTDAARIILESMDVPVVFLSSHTSPEIVEKTQKITSYGYVVKNSGITILDASIKMAFRLFEEKQRVREKQQELKAANEELIVINEKLAVINERYEQSQRELLEREEHLKKSEALLSQRLDLIFNPDADNADLDLGGFIDIREIQSVMDDFYTLTGMVTAVLDLNGMVLVATGWQDICTMFHRVHSKTAANCTESDLVLANTLKAGEYTDYRCKNGLWDVVTPLYIGDRHIGNIFTGQFFYDDDIIDEEYFLRQAAEYGFDRDAYMESLRKVPRYDRETIHHLMDFLVKFFGVVSRLSYANMLTARESTKCKLAEEGLKKSEVKFRAVFENSLDAICLYRNGIHVTANPAYLRLFGYESEEEVISVSLLKFIDPEERPKIIEMMQKRIKGEAPSNYETRGMRRDNTVFDLEITATSYIMDNERYTLAILRDVTDRKQAEQVLKIAVQDNKAFLRELQHRVKNSFGMISGMLSLMENDSRSDGEKAVLATINSRISAVSEMYSLLYSAESVSKIRLDEYLERVASTMPIASNNAVLEKACDAVTVPVKIAIPVGIIIVELITNAIKHAFPGGKAGTIKMVLKKINSGVVVEIADNGKGLPGEFDISTVNSLGLKLIHAMVKQINGSIAFENATGTRCVMKFSV